MTSLEFIEKEIEKTKSILEVVKTDMLTNNLLHLHQIKTELEAWAIIKGNLVLDDKTSNAKLSVCYRTKNYNKIKKALEIERSKNGL